MNLAVFTGRIYLETLDTRNVAFPYTKYGQQYRDAVGKMYAINWSLDTERMLAILKNIQPPLPQEEGMIPLTILEQTQDAERNILLLKARVEYKDLPKEPVDTQRLHGTEVTIEAYLESVPKV